MITKDALVVLFFFVAGTVFTFMGIFKLRSALRIMRNKRSTTGIVTNTRFVRRRKSDDDDKAYITVRFETNENKAIHYEQRMPDWGFTSLFLERRLRKMQGQHVKVDYNRNNPQEASINLTGNYFSAVATFGFGLVILTFAGFFFVSKGGIDGLYHRSDFTSDRLPQVSQ